MGSSPRSVGLAEACSMTGYGGGSEGPITAIYRRTRGKKEKRRALR